ncbi:MAG: sodium-translocating pyrophosphatase [Treponema sp.]|nr:sodium-translocating pyrophosphatase [Treponema sp.]MBP3607147.1 sodium-translocating pyrophosphatase [Treponema sp.]
MNLSVLLLLVALLALAYAAFNFFKVKRLDEGTDTMKHIASAIRIGANTFIEYEYKVLAIVILVVALIVWLALDWYCAVAILLGASMSASAGLIGMKIATYANVRVTNEARNTKNIGQTLKVAFRGGSVMGLCVAGFALLGLAIVYFVFGKTLGWMDDLSVSTCWLTKLQILKFPNVLSNYALGCSLVAMFNRVGGGIYTKAADMGADLVGKTEAHIPEDDPRNPATIADNVGDNVGDVAGLGSDLLESYVASIVSVIALAYNLVVKVGVDNSALSKLYSYPLMFAAIGLVACVIGVASLLLRNLSKSKKVHQQLNAATWIGASITILGGLGLSYFLFKDSGIDFKSVGFSFGWISPFIGGAIGVISGIVIGIIAEYYTSSDYKPTKILAEASREGSALTITSGLALGMNSCMAPCIVLGVGIISAYYIGGLYGVSMAAMGMLSFVALTVSVDSYGPISDNAGGIAEMSKLPEEVRNITDTLDAVGNTTAAIGKGFAIGSGGLAALSLMLSYMYSIPGADFSANNGLPQLNIMNPMTLSGAIVGGAIPFLFSGMLIDAVAKAARKMVEEVRRQFKEKPGILEGTEDPDYKTCIGISTKGSIGQMKVPALMAVVIPVLCGLLFGAEFVGGILIGSTICAIMIALFTGNSGGAWDNGKKYIEQGGLEGIKKGGEGYDEVHDASVVGDTVGDPLKDTVGPCMDIFIKIMATVSLVAVNVFAHYNLWTVLFK